MPRSRFVSSSRLMPLLVYCAIAFVVLLVADGVAEALGPARGARQLIVFAWMVLFPVGGYLMWKRG